MNFQEALHSLSQDEKRCAVGAWIDKQGEPTATDITNATEALPLHRVWRACKQLGMTSGHQTFINHVRGICRCGQ